MRSKRFCCWPIRLSVLLLLGACSSINSINLTSNNGPDKERVEKKASINLEVKKIVLDNGLTVLLVENHHLPILSYYTFYQVGAKYEKKGITGAAHFLEHLMFKGAKKYGLGVFDRIIESNGGTSNAYTSKDLTVYHENVPSDQIYKVIDMEADRMNNLLLDSTSFESERKVILEERKMRFENRPGGKIYMAMMQAVFVNTPYGGTVIGDIADLNTVSRDQIFSYFKKYYTPNNAIVVVVGDIDAQKVVAVMREKYGVLKKSEELSKFKHDLMESKLYHHRGKYNRSIRLHGASPTPQFMVALKGVPVGTRRSLTMGIVASVLGDGESSYFMQKYVKGATPQLNNIYAASYNLMHSGVFFLGGRLLEGVGLNSFKNRLFRDLPKSCGKAINDRSVQKAKNQYLVSYFNVLETNVGVAQLIGNHEAFMGDYNYYKKEMDIYESITVKEVMKECFKLFKKPNMIFLSIWDKHSKKTRK